MERSKFSEAPMAFILASGRSVRHPPGLANDNAFEKSFNRKVWVECRNAAWFRSLDDPRSKCEALRRDNNEHGRHSPVNDDCPIEFINALGNMAGTVPDW